jgi:hypothetical protein
MSVLIYAGSNQEALERLNRVVEIVFHGGKVDTCKTLESVARTLRRPRLNNDVDIAILVAANRKEVEILADMADMFENIQVILVLPDEDKETVSKGHLLRPRFLTYVDDDFMDIAAVLAKILNFRMHVMA